jgi:hypothetical protein|eukprot:COSAG06_NODE_758_length_12509_cov_13.139162_4_plen_45_part_00
MIFHTRHTLVVLVVVGDGCSAEDSPRVWTVDTRLREHLGACPWM